MFALLFAAAQSRAWEAFTDSATMEVTVALALLCCHPSLHGAAALLTLPSTNISTRGRPALLTPVLNAAWGSSQCS